MTVRAWVVMSVVLLAGSPAWSQSERLGDVAGTIKLNPGAVTRGGGEVVDAGQVRKADHELLGGVVADCAASARLLADLISDARATILYRGDDLPVRLEAASRELDAAAQEVYSLRLTAPFAEPLAVAREAASVCELAAASVRDELDRQGVAFTEASQGTAACRRKLEEIAMVLGGREAPGSTGGAGTAATEGPQPEGVAASSEVDRRVAERCTGEGAEGPDAYQRCLNRQYEAVAALDARTPANEMLEEGLFQDIRNTCRARYDDDFAARDQCEQEKMTAARLELEERGSQP
jgi:hypothetical protein